MVHSALQHGIIRVISIDHYVMSLIFYYSEGPWPDQSGVD